MLIWDGDSYHRASEINEFLASVNAEHEPERVQAQIALADNMKVLLGERYDIPSNDYRPLGTAAGNFRQN